MADEALSQAEVESLLNSLDSSPTKAAAAPQAAVGGRSGPKTAGWSRERVLPYDFKRPERVGKEQMRALQSLHEGFSRNFSAELSALLRSIVEVKLTSVDQLTYSEFIFSLENPTCFNLIRAEPLEGHVILDINPSILYPIIDRLLGGGKEGGGIARRPLTEIELRLVTRITHLFLKEMRRAWENVLLLHLSVDRVESNPQLVQIVPPNEVVILISFEVTLGELRGMMNMCIPFNTIERISGKLVSNSWVTFGKSVATPESVAHISRQIDRSLVDVVVTLAETKISTGDLIGLRVGDVVTTDKDVRSPLEVAVQGVPKYLASPGSIKGQKAIQIESAVPTLTVAPSAPAVKPPGK
jgi:flagellar motor switch protein FliM